MLEKMWASPFSILLLMITFSLVLTYSRLLPQQESKVSFSFIGASICYYDCFLNKNKTVYNFYDFAENALKEIAEQLGKKDWDFDANPCDVGNTNWNTPTDNTSTYQNNVTCNCSIPNNGFCHVESM